MEPQVVPTARLLLIAAGTATYHLDGHAFTVGAGDALLVPAMARRWWQAASGPFTMAWVEFLASNRTPVDVPAVQIRLAVAEQTVEMDAHRRLAAAHAAGGQAGRLRGEAELRAMLARVLTHPDAVAITGTGTGGSGDSAVRAAIAWLERHYAVPTPERELAQRVGLSANHFRLRFRACVGMSPRAFVLELRLCAARQWLAAGTLSVKQVASTVGWRDAALFSRLYRRRWGAPPSRDAVTHGSSST